MVSICLAATGGPSIRCDVPSPGRLESRLGASRGLPSPCRERDGRPTAASGVGRVRQRGGSHGGGTMTTVNILLVDDRPANLLALEAILDGLGLNLVRACSGEEALRHLDDEEFAAI